MKSKPKGARYRNLTLRGGVMYYERLTYGKRFRISTKTNIWEEAASFRDLYEAHEGIGRGVPFLAVEVPRFEDFAKRYLAEDTSHRAPTTRGDRARYLRKGGPILATLGGMRLDGIASATLLWWWNAQVISAGRKAATGRTYLDAVAGVLGYAVDLGILAESPVLAFRETLRRRSRTQRGRAEAAVDRNVCPIESPTELARLEVAAREEGPEAHALVVALLDAGLRLGEVLGLRWAQSSGATTKMTPPARSSSPIRVPVVQTLDPRRAGGPVA